MFPYHPRPDDEHPLEDAVVAGASVPAAFGGENLFSAELENVDASVWDVDADLIWGEDETPPVDDVDTGAGLDLPI